MPPALTPDPTTTPDLFLFFLMRFSLFARRAGPIPGARRADGRQYGPHGSGGLAKITNATHFRASRPGPQMSCLSPQQTRRPSARRPHAKLEPTPTSTNRSSDGNAVDPSAPKDPQHTTRPSDRTPQVP